MKRAPTIDGVDVDEFIDRNADPIWLTQNEMWEALYVCELAEDEKAQIGNEVDNTEKTLSDDDSDVPF